MKFKDTGKTRKLNAYDLIIEFMIYSVEDREKNYFTIPEFMRFLKYANKYIDMDIPEYSNPYELFYNFLREKYDSGEWMKDGEYNPHIIVNHNKENNDWEVIATDQFSEDDGFYNKTGRFYINEKQNVRIVLLNYYDAESLNPNYKFESRRTYKY